MSAEHSDEPRLYLEGKPVSDFHEVHDHVAPVWMYAGVLGSLFVLTGMTYLVSFLNLGPASLPVAMFVAAMKASLVCAFFMHLASDDGFYAFVFMTTLLFVAIFFGFTIFDLNSRSKINSEQDTFYRKNYGADEWEFDLSYKVIKASDAAGHGDSPAAGEGKPAEAAPAEGAPPPSGEGKPAEAAPAEGAPPSGEGKPAEAAPAEGH